MRKLTGIITISALVLISSCGKNIEQTDSTSTKVKEVIAQVSQDSTLTDGTWLSNNGYCEKKIAANSYTFKLDGDKYTANKISNLGSWNTNNGDAKDIIEAFIKETESCLDFKIDEFSFRTFTSSMMNTFTLAATNDKRAMLRIGADKTIELITPFDIQSVKSLRFDDPFKDEITPYVPQQ